MSLVDAGERFGGGVFVEARGSNGKARVGRLPIEPRIGIERGEVRVARVGEHHQTVGHGQAMLLESRAVPGFSTDARSIRRNEFVERPEGHDPTVPQRDVLTADGAAVDDPRRYPQRQRRERERGGDTGPAQHDPLDVAVAEEECEREQ